VHKIKQTVAKTGKTDPRIGLARASNIGSYFKINTPKESSQFVLFDGIIGYDWCLKSENLFVAK
jgi:hypothetical protein